MRSPHEHAIAQRLVSRGLRSHALHVRPRCRQEGVGATHSTGRMLWLMLANWKAMQMPHANVIVSRTRKEPQSTTQGSGAATVAELSQKSDSHTGDMSRWYAWWEWSCEGSKVPGWRCSRSVASGERQQRSKVRKHHRCWPSMPRACTAHLSRRQRTPAQHMRRRPHTTCLHARQTTLRPRQVTSGKR